MTFSLLQESEMGKVVNQLKKVIKDHERATSMVTEILAAWKEIATKEAAARKRKREESATGDQLEAPTPEKKPKISEVSSTSTISVPVSSTPVAESSTAPSKVPTGPSSTLTPPVLGIRKDFVNRITESLKLVSSSVMERITRSFSDTAVMIESATYDIYKNTDEDYKTHLRQVNYHLKQNATLREHVAMSLVEPAQVASMSPDDLVSAEMKAEAARIANEVTEARKPIPLEANCTTERCRKCNGNNIHVREAQTRSSDEPMTQFFTCLDCKLKWKI
jgi:transcription elongation factor S-II